MDSAILKEKYEILRKTAEAEGLFRRTYGFYALHAVFILCGTALSLFIITLTDSFYIQTANALFLAFVLVHAGMFGHDLSHGQVFLSPAKNRFFAVFLWGLLGGLSEGRWYEKHTAHHKYVNQIGRDPDVNIKFLFSKKQHAGRTRFLRRWVVPYQHILFFLALPLIYFGIFFYSVLHIYREFTLRSLAELILIAIHFLVLFYFAFAYLPVLTASVFLVLSTLVSGLYLSMVFAPNHKGKEIIGEDENLTWLHQITSTRNIYPSWVIFFIFGGLNFQIEHHLFTTMSRLNYWRAHKLVKNFCREENIPYDETTWGGSVRAIYDSLKEQSRFART